MTDSLTITLKTLTPLWTGGANGLADRLHLTGLIGSLRWWYEVLVRSIGGNACDPSRHSCLYNLKDPTKPFSGMCDVCRVFGATGWARRFRLAINDEAQLHPDYSYNRTPTASQEYVDHRGKRITPKWYLSGPPLSGSVCFQIIATDRQFPVEVISDLFQFLAAWGSIGAKPQMGLGVIDIADIIPPQKAQHLTTYLVNHLTPTPESNVFPSLQNMFFASMSAERFAPNETFNLKYDLRRLFKNNPDLRHFVMGTVKNERQAAKIMITHPYNGNTSLRIWGWIPEETSKFGMSREQVIELIYSHLRTKYSISNWREFNSLRDTTKQQCTNRQEFLESFMRGSDNA